MEGYEILVGAVCHCHVLGVLTVRWRSDNFGVPQTTSFERVADI
jgi:hypothetical protein